MSPQPDSTSIRDDDRAVSTVIGAVILFGFLIVTLSVYQAQVVPQENAQTEFQHSEEVRSDLIELRAGILQAGSLDQPQYQTVQLGTTYSPRTFAVNPTAPTGIIRTSTSYPITIRYASNGTVIETIPTRFIEYRPGYNELPRSPTWYDASVLYLDARDNGGGIAVIEDQTLVEGGEVQITAIQNEFRRSGTGRVTIELRPAESVTGDIPEGDLTVTIPTRLSEDDWESKTDLPTGSDVFVDVTDTGAEINNKKIYNLTLSTTANDLTIDTVGVQEAPEAPTQNNKAQIGNSNDDGGDGGNGGGGGGGSVNADVAFVSSTSGTLKTVRASGTITTYAAGGNIETIGSTVNLDADSATEVTFVDTSGNIEYIDSSDSSPTTLLSSVKAKKGGIAAGIWQGSQVSVFFANNNDEDGLYRKAPGGNRQLVATFPQKLRAVVGIGDIDDDGSDEIAAVTNGQKIAVLDDDGSTYVSGQQPASSSGLAIGGVADYNGDGQERIAIVDGSNNPVLVGCGTNPGGQYKCNSEWGGTTTLSNAGQAKKAPFGKGNIDGAGQPELVYPENINSPAELYGVSVSGDTVSDEAHITRSDGTRIEVVVAKGVSE
jgi:hypothetical protein